MMDGIGKRLKQIRLQNELTQPEMALRLDVSDRSYKLYENEHRNPPLEMIVIVADTFSVDLNWLAGSINGSAAVFERFVECFTAFNQARMAYVAFEKRNVSYSDSTQKERNELRAAGERLERLGGTKAMGAAVRAFFPNDPARTIRAGDELAHFWSHIGGWMA